MLIAAQLIAVLFGIGLTFLFYQAIGTKRGNLIFSRTDREAWAHAVGNSWLTWLTRTSILGTVTSLATVYLFFLGSSRLFGGWIFFCSVTLFLGAFITNWFTRIVCRLPRVVKLFESNDQIGGVIASLFWDETPQGKRAARIVKTLSMANIVGIIWLEFALFADIGTRLAGSMNPIVQVGVLFVCCYLIIYFTVCYGLRGFVFADIFHSPLIVIAILVLLVGTVCFVPSSVGTSLLSSDFYKPLLPTKTCIIFFFHVLCLNSFLVLLTEGHWLRIWLFREQETNQQKPSIFVTGLLWALLMLVGFYASLIKMNVGEAAVLDLLNILTPKTILFPLCFWLGGIAALFSTADPQTYGLLLVSQFDPNTGKLKPKRIDTINPVIYALLSALLFSIAYYLVRRAGIPLEKIVFLIIPMTLTILPGFIYLIFDLPIRSFPIIVSTVLYIAFGVYGLATPELEFEATLSAALSPVVISGILIIYFLSRGRRVATHA